MIKVVRTGVYYHQTGNEKRTTVRKSKENSFQFCVKNYLQTHGTAMGTKMAVAFANQIFYMGKVETEILSQSAFKYHVRRRYFDDIFSLWDTSREVLTKFIDQK